MSTTTGAALPCPVSRAFDILYKNPPPLPIMPATPPPTLTRVFEAVMQPTMQPAHQQPIDMPFMQPDQAAAAIEFIAGLWSSMGLLGQIAASLVLTFLALVTILVVYRLGVPRQPVFRHVQLGMVLVAALVATVQPGLEQVFLDLHYLDVDRTLAYLVLGALHCRPLEIALGYDAPDVAPHNHAARSRRGSLDEPRKNWPSLPRAAFDLPAHVALPVEAMTTPDPAEFLARYNDGPKEYFPAIARLRHRSSAPSRKRARKRAAITAAKHAPAPPADDPPPAPTDTERATIKPAEDLCVPLRRAAPLTPTSPAAGLPTLAAPPPSRTDIECVTNNPNEDLGVPVTLQRGDEERAAPPTPTSPVAALPTLAAPPPGPTDIERVTNKPNEDLGVPSLRAANGGEERATPTSPVAVLPTLPVDAHAPTADDPPAPADPERVTIKLKEDLGSAGLAHTRSDAKELEDEETAARTNDQGTTATGVLDAQDADVSSVQRNAHRDVDEELGAAPSGPNVEHQTMPLAGLHQEQDNAERERDLNPAATTRKDAAESQSLQENISEAASKSKVDDEHTARARVAENSLVPASHEAARDAQSKVIGAAVLRAHSPTVGLDEPADNGDRLKDLPAPDVEQHDAQKAKDTENEPERPPVPSTSTLSLPGANGRLVEIHTSFTPPASPASPAITPAHTSSTLTTTPALNTSPSNQSSSRRTAPAAVGATNRERAVETTSPSSPSPASTALLRDTPVDRAARPVPAERETGANNASPVSASPSQPTASKSASTAARPTTPERGIESSIWAPGNQSRQTKLDSKESFKPRGTVRSPVGSDIAKEKAAGKEPQASSSKLSPAIFPARTDGRDRKRVGQDDAQYPISPSSKSQSPIHLPASTRKGRRAHTPHSPPGGSTIAASQSSNRAGKSAAPASFSPKPNSPSSASSSSSHVRELERRQSSSSPSSSSHRSAKHPTRADALSPIPSFDDNESQSKRDRQTRQEERKAAQDTALAFGERAPGDPIYMSLDSYSKRGDFAFRKKPPKH